MQVPEVGVGPSPRSTWPHGRRRIAGEGLAEIPVGAPLPGSEDDADVKLGYRVQMKGRYLAGDQGHVCRSGV